MASKPSKSDGLRYGMTGFAHARQPAGAHPAAILALREGGNIREETRAPAAPQAGESPIVGPVFDTTATDVPKRPVTAVSERSHMATTPEPPIESELPHGAAGTRPADVSRANAGAPGEAPGDMSRRRSRRGSDDYKLPPSGTQKRRPRSHHFRFPEEIDDYLNTLAAAFDCTRTHVVCSAIRAEWQRLRRKKARDAKQGVTPH